MQDPDHPRRRKTKCYKGWPRIRVSGFKRLPGKEDSLTQEEQTKNENPHVLQLQRDHPFEGMSNPVAQVSMRCNVDVKYIGRAFNSDDLSRLNAADTAASEPVEGPAQRRRRLATCLDKSTGKTKQIAVALQRLIVDMSRDLQDVQFYTGEYSAKKGEVSRSLLPELHAGVVRLEQEEAERVDVEEPHVGNRERALSILRRLTFGMQRCVAKSNGEMAYQLLFQQEQLVTYAGYQMFFRFVAYAILRSRHEALQAIVAARPDLRAVALDVVDNDDPAGEDLVPILEIGSVEVLDKDVDDAAREDAEKHREQRVVSTNQKDDYLHRGSSALLSSMSMVMYARFVRRVPKSRVGLPDYVNLFPFAEHYAHFSTSLQDLLRRVVLFCFFMCEVLVTAVVVNFKNISDRAWMGMMTELACDQ